MKSPWKKPTSDAVTLADGRHLLVSDHTVREREFPAGHTMRNGAVAGAMLVDVLGWDPNLKAC